jgi:hypothetical protein
MATWDQGQTAPPLNDTKVDRLNETISGVIDELPTLEIDIPDHQIIKNLEQRIDDSVGYWNNPDGYNLRTARSANTRTYLNRGIDVKSLYRFQIPYQENQIYIAQQAILAYVTASTPQPEISPAQDTPKSKIFAQDLEKITMAHSLKVNLMQVMEEAVRNALNRRIGLIYLMFDPSHGKNGEIIPIAINPEEVVIDKNARLGENPAFICRYLKMTINEACSRWPEKQEDIYKECGIVRGTPKQLDTVISVREVWLTHYDSDYEAQEAVVYYMGELVLEKDRNPNWLYATRSKNFLEAPKKPFIPLNFDNDGQHWIDQTSAVEQATPIQLVLFKRGRQLMEIADKANGILVIDTRSGIDKAQSQDLTGDPNQHIVITGQPGINNDNLIYRLDPPEIPDFLMADKQDLRTTVHAIMGTPSEFSGSNDGDPDRETLGEAMMKKNQASGRQDLYVRAIDRFMNAYFNFLVQMMVVWYNEKHYFVYNGGDGEFDHLVISRDLIEDGIAVNVKSGTTLPFDKQRQEAVVLQLLKMGEAISLLDAYKLLHLQNPQQLYDNWAKQKTDPMALARDGLDEMDEAKAFIAYTEIMGGKEPKDPDDCSKEFVLSLRKLMISDDFLKAPRRYQNAMLKYTTKAVESLELRTQLDEATKEGIQALEPQAPLPPLPPLMPPPTPMGGQPPMGQPGMMPPPPGGLPPGMPPGMPPAGMPPQTPPMGAGMPGGGNVTAGLPLPNPAAPQTPSPGDVTGIPSF